jgi:hypothetical protein
MTYICKPKFGATMKTVIVKTENVNEHTIFSIQSTKDRMSFKKIEHSGEDLKKLYKSRFAIRVKKFVDKEILSKEFGKYFL